MQSQQLDSAEEHFTLGQLNPYTNYEAELLAHLTGYPDLAGYVDFKTDPEAPFIHVTSITESAVAFTWQPVPDVETYTIMLNGKTPVEMEVGPSTNTLTIDNLGLGWNLS